MTAVTVPAARLHRLGMLEPLLPLAALERDMPCIVLWPNPLGWFTSSRFRGHATLSLRYLAVPLTDSVQQDLCRQLAARCPEPHTGAAAYWLRKYERYSWALSYSDGLSVGVLWCFDGYLAATSPDGASRQPDIADTTDRAEALAAILAAILEHLDAQRDGGAG